MAGHYQIGMRLTDGTDVNASLFFHGRDAPIEFRYGDVAMQTTPDGIMNYIEQQKHAAASVAGKSAADIDTDNARFDVMKQGAANTITQALA